MRNCRHRKGRQQLRWWSPAADVRDAESVPGDGSPGDVQIPARVLAAGSESAVRTPATASVTSQAVLEEVWFAIHANQITPPAIPEVDFTSETVIIVILGERRSAGYSVRAAGVTRGERAVEVRIEVLSPSPHLMTASVLTSPFEISAISVTDTPVTFVGDDVRDGFDAE